MLRFSAFVQLALGLSLAACGSGDSGSSSTGGDTGAATDGAPDTQSPTDTNGGDSSASDTAIDAATDTALVPDADASSATIGKACTDGSTCGTDFCITDSRFTGGYCSEPITECPAPGGSFDPCPTGSSCVNGLGFVAGGASDFCLLDCLSDSDCRPAEGYGCCPGLGDSGRSVCAPLSYCPHTVDAGP